MRRSHWVQVKYRGGPEAWWEITFLGKIHRAPGHLALDDVLRRVITGTSHR